MRIISFCFILLGIFMPIFWLLQPILFISWHKLALFLFFFLPIVGSILLFSFRYLSRPAGIDNDDITRSSISTRNLTTYILTLIFTLFYIVIYFGNKISFPFGEGGNLDEWLNKHFYSFFNPLSYALSGKEANNWFFYGTLYTYLVALFGIRMILKYRHNRYHMIRTFSLVLVQLGLAYLLPHFLVLFQQPEFYFSYFWPLKAEYLYPSYWGNTFGWGVYFLAFGLFMTFLATPILTYFFGKRWYCSWVCGCGGMAETMGDPFRQLSDKSLNSWKWERYLIHSILLFISAVTILLWLNSVGTGSIFGAYSGTLANAYGFFIGSIFSGVIGVGFYPILGSRVWCRFGCPMASILGLFQKFFSRFRITTNGGQCISCGNCSTYCEMGIDVRWYAQRGQNIIRSSCVGCGVCSAVCPRGVLKLENKKNEGRYNGSSLFFN